MTGADLHRGYLPRFLLEWQPRPGAGGHTTVDGTLVLADVSGFTRLSEELAARGRIGAEQVTEVLDAAFSGLLDVATRHGGDLLSFGGDALLLLFDGPGHVDRALLAAAGMRAALGDSSPAVSPVRLSMSTGVASGPVHLVLAGSTNRELLVVGPVVDEVTATESAAEAGEIRVARSTSRQVDAAVAAGSGAEPAVAPLPEPTPPPTGPAGDYIPSRLRRHLSTVSDEGEHRLANVAFVSVRGTSRLIAGEGLETAAAEIDRVVAAVQDVAERFGVCFLASDAAADSVKLILTTGVPERMDAEEERILRAVAEISGVDSPLGIAAGVARGNVFAGDLGSASRRVYTVIGSTVNLAARMAAAAAPGETLVTDSILDRSTSSFEATPLEEVAFKGIERRVVPYRLGRWLSSAADRSVVRYPLVGRDGELEDLLEAVAAARGGKGSVVDLVGPAGIGKTRLLQELVDRGSVDVVHATAEPYEAATAYHLAGQVLRGALGLPAASDPGDLGATLAGAVTAAAPHMLPWLPLLARVAGAAVAATPEVAALDDRFQGARTAEAFAELLSSALTGPAVIVVDAAEWADPASATALERLFADVASLPWLVVISRRPGDGWSGPGSARPLPLAGLGPDAVAALLDHAVGDAGVPPPTRAAIAERSGGTPLFLLSLASAAAQGERELPETVEAAAMAAIDRLAPTERRLLRYAAVLGRRFPLDLLTDTAPELAATLDEPAARARLGEFLETSTAGTVRFRQPMTRDAAYAGLPYTRRATLHAAVAVALERRAGDNPQGSAEALSLHFSEAGLHDKAWTYAVMAAGEARDRYANDVAAEHYRRALAAATHLDGLPPSDIAAVAEALGDVAESAGLFEEAAGAFDRAAALVPGERLRQARLLRKKAQVEEKRGEYDTAVALLDEALGDDTDGSGEATRERLDAMLLYAGVLNRKSDHTRSAAWCESVLAEAGRVGYEAAEAHACNLLEANYTNLGHPDRGTFYGRALEIYRRRGDLVGEAKVLNNLGYNAYFLGDWVKAAGYWEESGAASSRAGDVVTAAMVANNLAEIDIDRGLLDQGRARLVEALRTWRGSGYPLGVAFAHANLGRLEGRAGRTDDALRHLAEAEALFAEVGSRYGVIDVHLRRGEALAIGGDTAAALEAAERTLTEASALPSAAVLLAALHRLHGEALLQAGDTAAARAALDRSLTLARDSQARFDEALALHALSRWARTSGEDDIWADTAAALLSDLGVETVFPPPR